VTFFLLILFILLYTFEKIIEFFFLVVRFIIFFRLFFIPSWNFFYFFNLFNRFIL